MNRTARRAPLVAAWMMVMLMSAVFAGALPGDFKGVFPRQETLYFGGLQWGATASYNPFHPNPNNWAYLLQSNHGLQRMPVFECLFAYNQLDGKLYGLLGKEYKWEDRKLVVTLNPDAKWSDGNPVTAGDVAFNWSLIKKYTVAASHYWTYLDSVVAVDDRTVVFNGNPDNFNPKMMELAISGVYVTPKHQWEAVDAECDGDNGKFLRYAADDPTLVSSGPYRFFLTDETKSALIRDDDYWGRSPSMFGKLPAPKYLVHNIYKDNSAATAAFKVDQIDMDHQFIPQIWKLWEDEKLPISTYIPEPPYHVPGMMASLWFNLSKPGLDDPAVRRALAMAIDYERIGKNAMSGYTPPLYPSLLLPLPHMLKLVDDAALKPLQWRGGQIDEANRLLDEAGWEKGAGGIREKNGVTLSFRLECPSGWTDWNAALEIVAQAGRRIGMDLTTHFRQTTVYLNDFQAGNVDLGMWSIFATNIAAPWSAAHAALSSVGVPERGTPTTFNFGRYKNARADELLAALSVETDEAKLKEMWTELNVLFLKDIPSFPLLYRPATWYEFNESVWTGFPKQNDGTNIPPTILIDGWGIKGLYNVRLK